MARKTEYIPDLFVPLSEGDGVSANAIVGVIPAANLPPEAPPQPVQDYVLPHILERLYQEITLSETPPITVWRLGSDAADITLANTYRFLFADLAANTAIPNEITLGTAISASAPSAAVQTSPAIFRPRDGNDFLEITQPSATNQFVLSFEFLFSPRLTTTRNMIRIKRAGRSDYYNVIGVGSSGIEYAIVTEGQLTTNSANMALTPGSWYRYIVYFRDVPNTNPITQTALPNLLRISEVLYNVDNAGTNLPQLLQSQDIDLGYSGSVFDYTDVQIGGQQFDFHEISGWQYDANPASPASRNELVDWIEHYWDKPLGGRVRAPQTTDIERIRFLEAIIAPRLFIGTTEVTSSGLLSAVQAAKIQGELLTAIAINGPNLLISKVEANGNIGSDTIALTSLVQDDSIGVDELDDALVARFLPTGGTDGQIIKRVSGVPAWADEAAGGSGTVEELVNWEPTTAVAFGNFSFQEFPSDAAFSRALTANDDDKLLIFELYGSDTNEAIRETAATLIIPASEWRNSTAVPNTRALSVAGKRVWFLPVLYPRGDGWRRGFIAKGANGRPGGYWHSGGYLTGLNVWLVSGGGSGAGGVGGQSGQQVGDGEVRDGTLDLGDFNPLDRAIIDPNYDLRADSTYGVLEAAVGSIHTGLVVENAVRHVSANVSNLVACLLYTSPSPRD